MNPGKRLVRIYRTGSPRGYQYAGLLMVLAYWTIWHFLHSPYIDATNRPIMAGISGGTFGGLALYELLRASVPAIILGEGSLHLRDWRGRLRSFELDKLLRVTWSYCYESGWWTGYDGGRAWLEFEFSDDPWRPVVADYAGHSRHERIREFVLELAERKALQWDPASDPLEMTDLPGAELVWRRAPADLCSRADRLP